MDQVEPVDSRLRRPARAAVVAVVLLLLVVPVALDRDGYPLSTYPMYSSARGPTTTFVTANGLDGEGRRSRLSLDLIGRSDDPLVVAGELRAALRNRRTEQRCAEIAERVSRSNRTDIVVVEVVSERHDTVDATRRRASLLERTVHTVCEVPW